MMMIISLSEDADQSVNDISEIRGYYLLLREFFPPMLADGFSPGFE